MANVQQLGFLTVWNLKCQYGSRQLVKPMCRYNHFSILQNVSRPLSLIFKKFKISTASMVWRASMHHRAKFCADRSNHYRNMAVFPFFKMAAILNLRLSKVRNFNCQYSSEGQYASQCLIWSNFLQIGQAVAKKWPFFDFSRWRPSAILDFKSWKF